MGKSIKTPLSFILANIICKIFQEFDKIAFRFKCYFIYRIIGIDKQTKYQQKEQPPLILTHGKHTKTYHDI